MGLDDPSALLTVARKSQTRHSQQRSLEQLLASFPVEKATASRCVPGHEGQVGPVTTRDVILRAEFHRDTSGTYGPGGRGKGEENPPAGATVFDWQVGNGTGVPYYTVQTRFPSLVSTTTLLCVPSTF